MLLENFREHAFFDVSTNQALQKDLHRKETHNYRAGITFSIGKALVVIKPGSICRLEVLQLGIGLNETVLCHTKSIPVKTPASATPPFAALRARPRSESARSPSQKTLRRSGASPPGE